MGFKKIDHDELKTKMDRVEIINWSSVARQAFKEQLDDYIKLQKLKQLKNFSSKLNLSNKDIDKLADKINKSVTDDFKKRSKWQMDLVIDANVLFTALVGRDKSQELFFHKLVKNTKF